MGNRRFEMHDYRHVISRIRLGESDRQIAKAGLMGRNKAAELREISQKHDWLNPQSPLPSDEEISKILSQFKNPKAALAAILGCPPLVRSTHYAAAKPLT